MVFWNPRSPSWGGPKQAPTAAAVVTIGKDMTFRDYAQGAFRMRGIGVGQRIAQGWGSARGDRPTQHQTASISSHWSQWIKWTTQEGRLAFLFTKLKVRGVSQPHPFFGVLLLLGVF